MSSITYEDCSIVAMKECWRLNRRCPKSLLSLGIFQRMFMTKGLVHNLNRFSEEFGRRG